MKKRVYLLIIIVLVIGAGVLLMLFNNDTVVDNNPFNYHIVAHSGGSIDGYNYTNSLESYYKSYDNGVRLYDADLRFTSDGVLVLRHEWSDDIGTYNNGSIMSYGDFINTKIYDNYTPMSYEDLLEFMKEHDDIYIFTDVKYDSDGDGLKTAYGYIVSKAQEFGVEYLLDHLVISFYTFDDYADIKDVYDFKYYIFRKYPNYIIDMDDIYDFCVENGIDAITMFEQYFSEDVLDEFHSAGMKLYLAVVDDIEKACDYVKMGVDGFVSNDLSEANYANCLN